MTLSLCQEYVAPFPKKGGNMAVPTGFEPATSGVTGRRALQAAPRDLAAVIL